MNTIQQLKNKNLLAKILFWTGQIIGTVSSVLLLLFVGGNVFGELIEGLLTFKDDYGHVIFVFVILCIVIGFIISWFRCRIGALITIASSLAAGLMWGFSDLTLLLILLLPLFSGILLLISAYQNESNP